MRVIRVIRVIRAILVIGTQFLKIRELLVFSRVLLGGLLGGLLEGYLASYASCLSRSRVIKARSSNTYPPRVIKIIRAIRAYQGY